MIQYGLMDQWRLPLTSDCLDPVQLPRHKSHALDEIPRSLFHTHDLPIPRKPRCKPVNRPRKEITYDILEPTSSFELPCFTSDEARNHVPNPYVNSRLTHEEILTICVNSTIFKDLLNIDYNQAKGQYPNGFPRFMRVVIVHVSIPLPFSQTRLLSMMVQ